MKEKYIHILSSQNAHPKTTPTILKAIRKANPNVTIILNLVQLAVYQYVKIQKSFQ
jgi:hypothetical protein